MVGTPNRFRVCYVDTSQFFAFTVHSFDEARWWSEYLMRRWDLNAWIDREDAPASRLSR